MLDVFNLSSEAILDIQVFNAVSGPASTGWQVWKKPRGSKFVYMLAVGGGGSGSTASNTTATSGGGGGGASGVCATLCTASMLIPDTLYISVGPGGISPVLALASNQGSNTYISLEPSINTDSTLLYASRGLGGISPTATAGGAQRSAGPSSTIGSMRQAAKGVWFSQNGGVGGAGGNTGVAAADLVFANTTFLTGGSGGGGDNGGAGGGILTLVAPLGGQYFPVAPTGGPTTLAIGGDIGGGVSTPGVSGYSAPFYMANLGGTGGAGAVDASSRASTSGGNGAPGCGGGGAGGSTTANPTLAKAGDGGNGFAIIISI